MSHRNTEKNFTMKQNEAKVRELVEWLLLNPLKSIIDEKSMDFCKDYRFRKSFQVLKLIKSVIIKKY